MTDVRPIGCGGSYHGPKHRGSGKCTIYAFDWTRVPSLALLLVKSILPNDFRVEGTWGASGKAVKTRVEHVNAFLTKRELPSAEENKRSATLTTVKLPYIDAISMFVYKNAFPSAIALNEFGMRMYLIEKDKQRMKQFTHCSYV